MAKNSRHLYLKYSYSCDNANILCLQYVIMN